MSDVVDVLERMGQDARWRYASPDDIRHMLVDAGLDPALLDAVTSDDQKHLEALLGVAPLCGMLVPGKEDEEQDDDTEKVPPGEDEEKSEHLLSTQPLSAR